VGVTAGVEGAADDPIAVDPGAAPRAGPPPVAAAAGADLGPGQVLGAIDTDHRVETIFAGSFEDDLRSFQQVGPSMVSVDVDLSHLRTDLALIRGVTQNNVTGEPKDPRFRDFSTSEDPMLEFLQAITGIFVVVYDGQHALKFHLGRAVGVVGPGVHFKFPIIQRFQVEPTKDTTLDLEPQVIQLSDELVYEVGAKVVYQIVDLRKAVIEVDKLVDGLKNRLVIIVQNVVKAQDRSTIRDMARMVDEVKQAIRPVEQQWGVRIHEFGFSTFSPTPETLKITQLNKLAQEKLALYRQLHDEQKLSSEAAVALISGAVMALPAHRMRVPEPAHLAPISALTAGHADGTNSTVATGDTDPDVAE
jgi:hypothetical protein